MKYTMDKILYFASRPEMLNVRRTERSTTTLRGLLRTAVRKNLLVRDHQTKEAEYYTLTVAGEIRLLEGQILYREGQGEQCPELKARLRSLRKPQCQPAC